MPFTMECTELPALPKLGWIARLDQVRQKLQVYHGLSVERGDHWLVEGVWGDDFTRGEFHKSESFFGSGIRIDGDSVHFVPSCAPLDRLFWCREGGKMLVSNSLIILLAVTGAELDENHDYHRESLSILKGFKGCKEKFSIVHPTIPEFHQVFMENIVVSEKNVTFNHNFSLHEFRSFDDYYGLLTETLERMRQNYKHPDRRAPFSTFSAISSGYDSTAVSALVKRLGVKDCFTARQAYSMIPSWLPGGYADDDGTPAARQLGMRVHYLESPEKISADDELYFLAMPYPKFSGLVLSEVIFHSMASYIERSCHAAIVFNGQYGGHIWNNNEREKYLTGDASRDVNSGLNLAEIRLKAGFVNAAVPFLFARNIAEVVNICRSEEMAPWRLDNDYDRPIARRIAESAGVSRDAFGRWKKSVCNYYRYPNNPQLRRAFFKYLENRLGISHEKVYLAHTANQAALFAQKALTHLKLRDGDYSRIVFLKNLDLPFIMWLWSAGILSQRLARRLQIAPS